MAANVRMIILIAFVAAISGCKSSAPTLTDSEKSLVGEYKQWVLFDDRYMNMDSAGTGNVCQLTLMPDHTFTLKVRSNIMINLTQDTSGTYKVVGSQLMLTGQSKYASDDGYKKSAGERAYSEALNITKEGLVSAKNPEGEGFTMKKLFRKTTDPAPIAPEPKESVSDPQAALVAKKVEDKYGSLQSYSDQGELTSNGAGFQAKDAKFVTYFNRSGEFRFEVRLIDEKKTPYQLDAVWSTGKKSWLYMGEIGGAAEERPIPNALSVISVGSGSSASLVPGLLMPEVFKEHFFSRFSLMVSEDQKIGTQLCYQLECSLKGKKIWTLWIDKRSLLILKAKSGFAEELILYSPQENPKLTAIDLKPNLKI